jgi:hypothetical protein
MGAGGRPARVVSSEKPVVAGVTNEVLAPVFVAGTRVARAGEKAVFDGFVDLLITQLENERTVRSAQGEVFAITLEPNADLKGCGVRLRGAHA